MVGGGGRRSPMLGVAAIPTASADSCVITVTLIGGGHLSFTVNVPPGTPLSQISLPVHVGVIGVTESCAPSSTTTTTTPTTSRPTPTTSTSTQQTSTSSRSSAPKSGGGSKKQKSSSHKPGKKSSKSKSKSNGSGGVSAQQPKTKKSSKPATLRGTGGVPSAANPTYSFSLPGAAPLGVPNFFIDSFQIPPFLLPIYQAAGIEYDVPWQVLAAINEIETDYGRNLSCPRARARWGGCSSSPRRGSATRSQLRGTGSRIRTTRSMRSSPRPGICRRRALRRTSARRSSPTTTPAGTCSRCCCARS